MYICEICDKVLKTKRGITSKRHINSKLHQRTLRKVLEKKMEEERKKMEEEKIKKYEAIPNLCDDVWTIIIDFCHIDIEFYNDIRRLSKKFYKMLKVKNIIKIFFDSYDPEYVIKNLIKYDNTSALKNIIDKKLVIFTICDDILLHYFCYKMDKKYIIYLINNGCNIDKKNHEIMEYIDIYANRGITALNILIEVKAYNLIYILEKEINLDFNIEDSIKDSIKEEYSECSYLDLLYELVELKYELIRLKKK